MIQPTPQATALRDALVKRGIECISEYSDGHKHVDIYIPSAKLYIEINGIQHYIDPKQVIADFSREHYSDEEGFATYPITNQLVETHLEDVANGLADVVKTRVESMVVSKR